APRRRRRRSLVRRRCGDGVAGRPGRRSPPRKYPPMTIRPAEASVEGAAMREVLGHFATGVVVVTAAAADGPLGFTCQSFGSLSLEPPLVSLAPARTSSTWPRIREVGAFC